MLSRTNNHYHHHHHHQHQQHHEHQQQNCYRHCDTSPPHLFVSSLLFLLFFWPIVWCGCVVAVVAEILSRLSLHRRPQIILTPVNQPSSCQSSPAAFTVTHSCAGLSHLLWVKASQRTTKHSNCPFQVRQNTLQIELLACPERELMLCTFSLHGNSLTRLALYTTLMFSFLRRFLLSSFSCQY